VSVALGIQYAIRMRRFFISGLSNSTTLHYPTDGIHFEENEKNVIVGKMCQADMTKLRVAFPSFANRSQNRKNFSS
jgi:hypothetical protein